VPRGLGVDIDGMNARLDTVYRFGAALPPEDDASELWVPARFEAVASLRGRLGAVLVRQGWNHEQLGRVTLATTEALANAVGHGSTGEGRIGFAFRVTAETAWVRVIDEGRSDAFVPAGHPTTPPPDSESGRGRVLMRALSDGYLSRSAGSGTEVVLQFRRRGNLAA
jgi:anti-sigma regulatory factor (Ser/Thr protein kinase)